jgi:hypothetical protein
MILLFSTLFWMRFILYVDYRLCITWIIPQQLWGYKVEEKVCLRVSEKKKIEYHCSRRYSKREPQTPNKTTEFPLEVTGWDGPSVSRGLISGPCGQEATFVWALQELDGFLCTPESCEQKQTQIVLVSCSTNRSFAQLSNDVISS